MLRVCHIKMNSSLQRIRPLFRLQQASQKSQFSRKSTRLVYSTAVSQRQYEEQKNDVATEDSEQCYVENSKSQGDSLFCDEAFVIDRRGERFYERSFTTFTSR
mmetsp:Transcript_6356/g.7284  ORF Transcript_6356/g.7284 Transcript_6356/m.7284 type:complete len:103 (+) Transcript_6356:306-614(+)